MVGLPLVSLLKRFPRAPKQTPLDLGDVPSEDPELAEMV